MTNWPNSVIDRELAARNPEPGHATDSLVDTPDMAALLDHILAVDPYAPSASFGPLLGTSGGRLPAGRRLVSFPRFAIATVIVAAIAAIALVLGTSSSTRHPSGTVAATRPTGSLSAVLVRVARVAGERSVPTPLGPGQFVYTDETVLNEVTTVLATSGSAPTLISVLRPMNRQVWLATNGSGRIAETAGASRFLTAADKARWVAAGSPEISGPTVNQTYGRGGVFLVDLTAVPTDPATVARLLSTGELNSGGLEHPPSTVTAPTKAKEFENIGDLLDETGTSPQLRSALYLAAADLPGVALLGSVTDDNGRAGTDIAFTSDGQRVELIFDPTTSALLEKRTVVAVSPTTGPNVAAPVGAVIEYDIYLRSGVVDSTSSTVLQPSTGVSAAA